MVEDGGVTRAEFDALRAELVELKAQLNRHENWTYGRDELVKQFGVDIWLEVPGEVSVDRLCEGDRTWLGRQVLDSIRARERAEAASTSLFGVDDIDVFRDPDNVGWTATIPQLVITASAATPEEALQEVTRIADDVAEKNAATAPVWPLAARLDERPRTADEFTEGEWDEAARRTTGLQIVNARRQLVSAARLLDVVARSGTHSVLIYTAAAFAPLRERLEQLIDPQTYEDVATRAGRSDDPGSEAIPS